MSFELDGIKVNLRGYLEMNKEKAKFQLYFPLKNELSPELVKSIMKTDYIIDVNIEGFTIVSKEVKDGKKIKESLIHEFRIEGDGIFTHRDLERFRNNPLVSKYVDFE